MVVAHDSIIDLGIVLVTSKMFAVYRVTSVFSKCDKGSPQIHLL